MSSNNTCADDPSEPLEERKGSLEHHNAASHIVETRAVLAHNLGTRYVKITKGNFEWSAFVASRNL